MERKLSQGCSLRIIRAKLAVRMGGTANAYGVSNRRVAGIQVQRYKSLNYLSSACLLTDLSLSKSSRVMF